MYAKVTQKTNIHKAHIWIYTTLIIITVCLAVLPLDSFNVVELNCKQTPRNCSE